MTINPENIAKAKDLLNAIEDLGRALELMAAGIDDDDYLGPFGQIGVIIREKADAAVDFLSKANPQTEPVKRGG